MNRTYLRELLLSPSRQLLIRADELPSILMTAFALDPNMPSPGAFLFFSDPKTYKEQTEEELKKLQQSLTSYSDTNQITLTTDYASTELPCNSIAYHRIFGFITADSRWFFSSKQLERDLMDAEKNPAITCHFLHVNSAGGEAWYLDRLSQSMRELKKPVMALIEMANCSAAYYITCHAGYLAALTNNDTIGSIGTMVETYNIEGYYEKLGIKIIREKSDRSDLKNKKYEDLRDGKPQQYIREVLNPITDQFIAEVRTARPLLNNLPEDDPVFRGETFDTALSIEKGLIDGMMTFVEAVAKASEMGSSYAHSESIRKSALNYV